MQFFRVAHRPEGLSRDGSTDSASTAPPVLRVGPPQNSRFREAAEHQRAIRSQCCIFASVRFIKTNTPYSKSVILRDEAEVNAMKSVAMHTKRVRVSVLSDFSAKEVADYIFNPDVVETWPGSHSRIRKKLYSNAILMQVSHNLDRILEEGTIVSFLWPASTGNPIPVGIYQITASMPKTYGSSLVHIRISPQSGGGCRIRIQQDNIPDRWSADKCIESAAYQASFSCPPHCMQ